MDSIILTALLWIVLLVLLLAASFTALLWYGPMLLCFVFGGAPYVPSKPARVKQMMDLAKLTGTEIIADLGSGDGRIVVAAVQAGAKEGTGYEIVPALVWYSRLKARLAKLGNRACFRCKSMWDADLSKTDIVFLYQITYAMENLSKMLTEKLPNGARVISNGFQLPNLAFVEESGSVRVYRIEK
jgi:hypothetical protein